MQVYCMPVAMIREDRRHFFILFGAFYEKFLFFLANVRFSLYICKQKRKEIVMMFVPCDTILLPLIVIGVFVYYGLQSLFAPPEKKDEFTEEDRKFIEDLFRENSPDYRRYQRWLEEHQQ